MFILLPGFKRQKEEIKQLRAKKGPHYEKWRKNLLAGVSKK